LRFFIGIVEATCWPGLWPNSSFYLNELTIIRSAFHDRTLVPKSWSQ
jgi:hypothetical protein